MKPWEVIATLLTAMQLHVVKEPWPGKPGLFQRRAVIMCHRTRQEITLDNVKRIQVEHWPERHKHGGAVDPKNAIISLKEGHAIQTKREKGQDAKERRVKRDRKFTPNLEKKKRRAAGKPTGWRWKKPMGRGKPVKVPTYD